MSSEFTLSSYPTRVLVDEVIIVICSKSAFLLLSGSYLNPIQDGGGGGKKAPRTSFYPVNSTNVGISPQNFPTFGFNPFATLVQNLKAIPSDSPNLFNLNQDHPSHTNARVNNLWSHDHIYNII